MLCFDQTSGSTHTYFMTEESHPRLVELVTYRGKVEIHIASRTASHIRCHVGYFHKMHAMAPEDRAALPWNIAALVDAHDLARLAAQFDRPSDTPVPAAETLREAAIVLAQRAGHRVAKFCALYLVQSSRPGLRA